MTTRVSETGLAIHMELRIMVGMAGMTVVVDVDMFVDDGQVSTVFTEFTG